jgi:putative holliday junction resolvase
MRTLAIDLGTKRIGLAMSDAGGMWATPLEVIAVNDPQHAIAPIVKLIEKEGVERLVVGVPLNMDDTIGPQARSVIAWCEKLMAAVGSAVRTDRFVYVDERLSSFDAEQRLIDIKRSGAKMTRKDKKQSLDAVAAAGFLQAFLDGKLAPIDPRRA